jgi:hypothetical protein
MITTNIINETYINRILNRDLAVIQSIQADTVSSYLEKRSGNLEESLAIDNYVVSGTTSVSKNLPYLRFLDKKYRKGMLGRNQDNSLYNKAIWGVLYRKTYPALRYGLNKEIYNNIKEQLISVTSQNIEKKSI